MRELHEQRNPAAAAFTLIELLVSMSVLALLLIMVSQLINSASQVTAQGGKHLDADTQARMLFNRMAIDFANMVNRPDVDTLFYRATGNDKMFFFSQAPAYYDSAIAASTKSSVALVGYRVAGTNGDVSNHAPPYSLQRFGKGLLWDGVPTGSATPGSLVYITGIANTLPATWPAELGTTEPYDGVSSYYHVLADQVFRMEVCFQVKNVTNPNAISATYSNYPVAISAATTIASGPPSGGNVGARWYDTANNRAYLCTSGTGTSAVWRPNGLKDVLNVVVTIAILDSNSRKMTGSDLSSLVLMLKDPSDGNLTSAQLPAQTWKDALQTALKNNSAGIPQAAAAQIRIYQRHFYLNSNQ